MLGFFRINDPYRLIFIFLILVAVRVSWIVFGMPLSVQELKFLVIGERLGDGFTMYKELYDSTGPLSALVYKYLDLIFGRSRWVHVVFSTLLIIVQAGLLNNILLRNKATEENTYIPAFLYVILFCGTMDYMALSPQLMALTFILLSLNHVFRRIDNEVTDELFLYSGLYLGIATFFYLPALIYLVLFLISLILFSTAVVRRLLIFLYGSFVVFLVIWSYFFWFDAGSDFVLSFFQAGVLEENQPLISYFELGVVGVTLLVVAILSFSVFFTQRVTNFQQKMQQVMILLFVGSIIVFLLSKDLSTNDLILVIPPITFFLSYYLLGLRKRIWRFVMPYLIIFSLIGYPFYWVKSHENELLEVKEDVTDLNNEKLMGIGVPIDFYANNKLSGPFFDEYISSQQMQGLDYLDGASNLFAVMQNSNPSVIIDEREVMPQIFHRFPSIAKKYELVGDNIYHRKD